VTENESRFRATVAILDPLEGAEVFVLFGCLNMVSLCFVVFIIVLVFTNTHDA